jgi:hypothetical protein
MISVMRTLLFSAVIALASIGCSDKSKDESAAHQDLPEMTVEEVAAGLETKQLVVVDCNGEKTRKKHGILPSAILIEDEETYPASVLPADKTTKLLFYCGGPG